MWYKNNHRIMMLLNPYPNKTIKTASSVAAQNEYITNAMACNTIDEEQVVQNTNDKGFFLFE